MKRYLVVLPIMALSACSWENYPEAGREVDRHGNFGFATTNNLGIQTGEKSYTLDLAHRFADEIPTTVNFAFNSAQLDGEARAILRQQADWIRQFPEVRFRVYGHTDAVGSKGYNYALGKRRAEAIVSYLASLGIGRDRLEALVSRGETQPLIVTEGRERRNRRTVTEVSGFVERHPSVLDGKYAEIVYRDYVASAQAASGLSGTSIDGND
jgi:outer membrane protein OmpA-like peptidoglycan-associated protein